MNETMPVSKNAKAALPAAVLITALSLLGAPSAEARERISMDAGWRIKVDSSSPYRNAVSLLDWRWIQDDKGRADAPTYAAVSADTAGSAWHSAKTGDETFGGRSGYSWFRATLPDLPAPHRVIHFASVDDNADVYLNGTLLKRHEGWDDPFEVPLDAAWKVGGPNVLAVLVQNTAGGGGMTGLVTLGNLSAQSVLEITPTSEDSSWRVVHLPHDYVVEQPFTQGLDANHASLPTPPAWYRKTFSLPAADKNKSIWLDFDGVYRDSVVFLNGVKLGRHPSGYTPARYFLTGNPALKYGAKNDLAVSVNPSAQEGWWYEGGGIYRHVWLNVADPLHVAPWGTHIVSTLPAGQDVSNPTAATLAITTTVRNDSARAAQFTLVSEALGPDGKPAASVSTPATVPAGSSVNLPQTARVARPRLWSIEQPRRYALRTQLIKNGAVADEVTTPFGIRTIRFDKDTGFFLNGKHVEINGVCNHQDFAGVGTAMPDSVLAWRTKKLKEMGCNAFRTSHNMVAEELLDECDRQGMLVMDENRHLGDTYAVKAGPGVGYSDLSDLNELLLRDRNHPSVILWSLCNEEWTLQGSSEGAVILKAMMDRVHKYDKTRPVSTAMNGGVGNGFSLVEDLQGINYQSELYQSFHESHPDMPVYGSEIGSNLSARGVYSTDNNAGLIALSALGAQGAWEAIALRPYMTGGFVWTGFDYKGEPTPYHWPDINSNFGLMDEAGFPKDYYYYYKAQWLPNVPMAHLFPPWNHPGQEGKPVTVYCYGNTARVELFLNGVSLGAKDLPRWEHAEWSVPYAPGALTVKGYDAKGSVTATDTEVTTGAPAGLKLTCENPVITANGEEVAMIEVAVVDAGGHVAPTASNPVTFAASSGARVVGTGNGDPTDHTPDRSAARNAFNGHVLGVVGATDRAGRIIVTATSPGLPPAQVTIQCIPDVLKKAKK